MFIDFHVHENTYSSDSHMNLKEIVVEARQVGLDAVCITDHDSMGLVEYAKKYSEEVGFPIFVGAEYYSLEGDILVFGIDKLPDTLRLPAQDIIDYAAKQGGVCIAAHPFRNNNRGLAENLKKVKGLAGIEVLNGSASMEANRMALKYAKELGIQCTGASDAHDIIQLGRYATYIPGEVKTMDELVEAIRQQKCRPAILKGYNITDTF